MNTMTSHRRKTSISQPLLPDQEHSPSPFLINPKDFDDDVKISESQSVLSVSHSVSYYVDIEAKREKDHKNERDIAGEHFIIEHRMRNPFVMILGVTTYSGKASNGWNHLPGVTKDVSRMTHLFRSVLLFDTQILTERYPECTESDIISFRDDCRHKVNNSGHRKYDGLICIMSGHGMQDKFISGDGKEININEDFFVFFNNRNAKLLGNYPKIFLFDACRGDMPADIVHKLISTKGRELISCNVQDNFRISYATTPGKTALDDQNGGHFVKAFYDVMMYLYNSQRLNATDLQTILRMTSQKSKVRTENWLCPVLEDYTNYKIFIKCRYSATLQNECDTLSLKRYNRIKKVSNAKEKAAADKKEEEAETSLDTQENQVLDWLRSLRLEKYFNRFHEEGWDDMSVILEKLNDEKLQRMGIEKEGHRAKILSSIEKKVDEKTGCCAKCCCCCVVL